MLKPTKGVQALLSESWSLLRTEFSTFAKIISAVFIAFVVAMLGFGLSALSPNSVGPFVLGTIITFIGLVAIVILGLWSSVALIEAADHAANKKKYHFREVFAKDTWLIIINVLVAGTFYALVVMIGLYLIIPGIMLAVWLAFYKFIVILERKNDIEALVLSYKIVKGRFWSLFWRFLAFGILVNLAIWVLLGLVFGVSYGIGYVTDPMVTSVLLTVLMAAFYLSVFYVIMPYAMLYTVILYRDFKKTAGKLS